MVKARKDIKKKNEHNHSQSLAARVEDRGVSVVPTLTYIPLTIAFPEIGSLEIIRLTCTLEA